MGPLAEGNLSLTLLNQRQFVDVAINRELNLTLHVSNLARTILLTNDLLQEGNDLPLGFVGLPCAGLGNLGLRSFLNRSLIQITKLREILINCHLVGNLLPASILEDCRRDNDSLLDAVLINEGVLEISRVHAVLFLLNPHGGVDL